jgi:putative CocE/NonD family hydrolase
MSCSLHRALLGLARAALAFASAAAPAAAAVEAASTPTPPPTTAPAVVATPTVPIAAFVRASYTKHERTILMRDGARLHTAIYVPKDESRRYAILLQRTPYNVAPYGADTYRERLGPSERYAREGFIFVYQDVRGRNLSEGDFTETTPHRPHKTGRQDVDESTDTWDTIEWLVKNVPNNNGRVGMYGISYPGFYVAAGMIDAHPALKAASPQAPIADLYMGDDCYHGGAFMLAANFSFFTWFVERDGPRRPPAERPQFDYGTTDGYQYFLDLGSLANSRRVLGDNVPNWYDLLEHTTYDQFWQSRAITPHLRRVAPAVLTVGGWFDAEDLAGPLAIYRSIEEKNPGIDNHLVMGPWAHGGWSAPEGSRLGPLSFGSDTNQFYRDRIEYPFFDGHLNRDGDVDLPEAWVFETGTNQWRRHDAWPPAGATERRLVLGAGGTLTLDGIVTPAPGATSSRAGKAPGGGAEYDEYVSDPARPVPFLPDTALGMPDDYMTRDQRFAGRRGDVLVYESEPLTADVAVSGPIGVDLWVSTTGTDSDFVVKLIDAYPADYPDPDPDDDLPMGGFQQLVRGEPFRAKFRSSFTTPQPMTPGEPTRLRWTMPDVAHVFRAGHRIVVQIQSSWFPLTDRNPQTFTDIPNAKPEDFRPATQRVYHAAGKSSALELPVLDASM